MGFLAVVNAYTMRISLSVAITEMVMPMNKSAYDTLDSCPDPESSAGSGGAVTVRRRRLFVKETLSVVVSERRQTLRLGRTHAGAHTELILLGIRRDSPPRGNPRRKVRGEVLVGVGDTLHRRVHVADPHGGALGELQVADCA